MDSPTSVPGSPEGKMNCDVSKHVKEKTQKCQAAYPRKRPLNLLELPVDILQLIVKEACACSTMASGTTY
jgi:hypothetical protein